MENRRLTDAPKDSTGFNGEKLESLGKKPDLLTGSQSQPQSLNLQAVQSIDKKNATLTPPRSIHLFLHELKIYWTENTEMFMGIFYDTQSKQDIEIIVDTSIYMNYYMQFTYANDSSQIEIAIYEDCKLSISQNKKKKIKSCKLNVGSYPVNQIIKTRLILEDWSESNAAFQNWTTSEIEVSLIIATEPYQKFQDIV